MSKKGQPGLFDKPPGDRWELHRRTDPATSKAAAYAVNLNALERLVVEALRDNPEGLTTAEIASTKGVERDSISPRIPRLVKAGIVYDSGSKRVPEGRRRAAIIWKSREA